MSSLATANRSASAVAKSSPLYSTRINSGAGMCTSGGMLAAAGADALCRPSCVIHLLRASAPAVAAVAQGPQAICNMHACIVKSGIQSETPSQARAACHQACACTLTAADQQSRAYCTCTCAHAQTGRKAGRQADRRRRRRTKYGREAASWRHHHLVQAAGPVQDGQGHQCSACHAM